MSAWVVDQAHIDVLMDVAAQYGRRHDSQFGWYVKDGESMKRRVLTSQSDTGRMLLRECVKSVSARYPADSFEELPGPRPMQQPEDYTYRPTGRRFSEGEAFQAIGCFEYQSCEHKGWEQSEAYAFCQALRQEVVGSMYPENGVWGWTDQDLGRKGRKVPAGVSE